MKRDVNKIDEFDDRQKDREREFDQSFFMDKLEFKLSSEPNCYHIQLIMNVQNKRCSIPVDRI